MLRTPENEIRGAEYGMYAPPVRKGCQAFMRAQEWSFFMKQMSKTEIVSVGLMMFSIFFGAGNLIFPPALGQSAGENLLPAMSGFLLTGIGLPLLGIVAIALAGGDYVSFMGNRVSKKFAGIILGLLYLTIGPLFAVPRTGAVSFEIGIRPFLEWEQVTMGQGIYTAVFFLLTFWLALNPSKLVDRVGKTLTPALLLFLVVLFVKTFASPLGPIMEPQGIYQTVPFAQGFQNGYLTMDLLASLAVGTIVVQAIKARGVTETHAVGRLCFVSGLIAVVLMSLVYLSLSYLGATSAARLGIAENGAVILSKAAQVLFGTVGQSILAAIIALACLTTSCGMVSAFASHFYEALGHRVSYGRLVLYASVFGFAASNIGLTELIRVSVPFLVALYPVIIVLVLLTMVDRFFGGSPMVYRGSLLLTTIFGIVSGLKTAGIDTSFVDDIFAHYLPLYDANLGWILPALLGAAAGGLLTAIHHHGAAVEENVAQKIES